jgi:pimeloyl-ACP methyl ester carboxylesterase
MLITRHIANLSTGALHFRQAGNPTAPPTLILHQAPQSGAAYQALLPSFAEHSEVFVPDMPGFGYSDALPATSIDSLTDALGAWLRTLGRKPMLVYGLHTGAVVAARLALRYPDVIEELLLDGYPLFTPAECAELLMHNFPDYRPVADGSHLIDLWQRFVEQLKRFPYYMKDKPWAEFNIPASPERLHQLVRFSLIGEAPWEGYRSVFRFNDIQQIAHIKHACTLLYRPDDFLSMHVERLPKLPDNCQIERKPVGFDGAHQLLLQMMQCRSLAQKA